jgi:peptidoglycan/xylan/chitin deacetylase (PgdA/CDA1 family)
LHLPLFRSCRVATRPHGICALVFLLLAVTASNARAAACEKNPPLLGAERTIAVDPRLLPRVGTLQYPEALPLRDHEVVLTFDDGPLPSSTGKVLDALAEECVPAIFFVVGERVAQAPALVLRAAMEGHAIGTHTQTHPRLSNLTVSDAEAEVRAGVITASAALGSERPLAPFFRAPYLDASPAVEEYLTARGLMLWGIDVDSEDWRGDSPDELIGRVFLGLERLHKGIILMHDVQPHTAEALPRLLKQLRTSGYRVVRAVEAHGADSAAAAH